MGAPHASLHHQANGTFVLNMNDTICTVSPIPPTPHSHSGSRGSLPCALFIPTAAHVLNSGGLPLLLAHHCPWPIALQTYVSHTTTIIEDNGTRSTLSWSPLPVIVPYFIDMAITKVGCTNTEHVHAAGNSSGIAMKPLKFHNPPPSIAI